MQSVGNNGKGRHRSTEIEKNNLTAAMMSTPEQRDQPQKKESMHIASESTQEARERLESVLCDVSKEVATVMLLMPPIAISSGPETRTSSFKTKDSFDMSFSSIDTDENTVEDLLDGLEEELVGLCLLPKQETSEVQVRMQKSN